MSAAPLAGASRSSSATPASASPLRTRRTTSIPPTQPEAVTGVILAGGFASRLGGVDKAALDVDGRPVIERVIAALSSVSERLIAIVNDDRFDADTRLTVIRDPDPHAGVLPALHAALAATTTPLAVVVACD